MCMTRTWIFKGHRVGALDHHFELYSVHTSEVQGCPKDPREQEAECVWPVWEDIWSGQGGPEGRVHFRVVVTPAHWSEQEMRESIVWWGKPSPGQVVP